MLILGFDVWELGAACLLSPQSQVQKGAQA